ncbi:MAG: hypothetical protein IGQ45_05780 [Cyanobacterium sp. T60_A2020_053]|nr:hypothetical protein [Cyanobacterium sp. T60_A2020_053]
MMIYNKLIRDKIPDILSKNNLQYNIDNFSDHEYQQALKDKLLEEVQELLISKNSQEIEEEIADIYEVLDSLIDIFGLNQEKIKDIQVQKRIDKGSFRANIKLVSVTNKSYFIIDSKEESVLQELEIFLEEKVKSQAEIIDFDSYLLANIVNEIKTINPLWFNLKVPKNLGGLEFSNTAFYRWQTLISQYSGALSFLQTQHQSALHQIANSDNYYLREKYLAPSISGKILCGVGFSHLRRRDKVMLSAKPVNNGYQLTGDISWITGYNFFDYFIVGATLPDGSELKAITPFSSHNHGDSSLNFSEIMRLGALSSTNTVTGKMVNWFIPQENLVSIKPPNNIHQQDQQNILHHGFFALGNTLATMKLIKENCRKLGINYDEKLTAKVVNLEEEMFSALHHELSYHEKLQLRVKAIKLAYECAEKAVMSSKGGANLSCHPANRLYREALVYSVSGQTMDVLTACLC